MTDQFKNIIIGMFVIAACVIVIFLLLFIHPSTGNKGETLKVLFTEIDKINIGSRVTFAGKPIGEVKEIKEIEFDRNGPKDAEGHVYIYELTLVVDSSIRVYNTDIITLRTSGLLGERSVAIIPMAPKKGEKPILLTDKVVIFATPVTSVEETLDQFKDVAHRLDRVLDDATDILDDIKDKEVVAKISQTIDNLKDITAALDKPDEINAMVDNFVQFSNTLAQRLPKSWDTVDKSLDQVHSATTNANKFTVTANDIINKVKRGEGTIGRLLERDDLYIQLSSLLNKGETVMDDINHYGLLFHLDKGWQRMRSRRANLLMKLSNPQEFRNFFNDELNQVSTALSRVNTVLEKTNANTPYPIVIDPEFAKVYSELLRRVNSIEDNLKMYNEQVNEANVQQTELISQY